MNQDAKQLLFNMDFRYTTDVLRDEAAHGNFSFLQNWTLESTIFLILELSHQFWCLKGTGAGCPHMPQDEPAGKTTGLAEQGALAGTQEKKRRVYHLRKKGQASREEYRGLIRSCREEIRKAKAQLELRLATVVRVNKKCFYKYVNNKKTAKESLHPSLDAGGNTATKHEEKAGVLNAFFASVFISQTGYSQGSQPPVLEDGEGEWNKPPIIREEAVNDLLCHLDT